MSLPYMKPFIRDCRMSEQTRDPIHHPSPGDWWQDAAGTTRAKLVEVTDEEVIWERHRWRDGAWRFAKSCRCTIELWRERASKCVKLERM